MNIPFSVNVSHEPMIHEVTSSVKCTIPHEAPLWGNLQYLVFRVIWVKDIIEKNCKKTIPYIHKTSFETLNPKPMRLY